VESALITLGMRS